MKTIIIHHSADFDGLFCREIARKFLPDAELIGWDFGDAPLGAVRLTTGDRIYVMDLPIDRVFAIAPSLELCKNVIWLDHHASSIASHPTDIPGYRIDGVAACRLAWQWFSAKATIPNGEKYLPEKREFVERMVPEPLAVRLAGEYDIWDKRDSDAELFQHGLRSRDLEKLWPLLLEDSERARERVFDLLETGRGIQYAKAHENESIIKHQGFTFQFEGLNFLACNHARYNSHLFTAGLTPEHDACFGFKYSKGQWEVSLYHAPGKEHHDLSRIAVKYGGGGHRGACGFRVDKLPFLS